MTRARDIANLVDANGDIVAGALDNVPAADLVNDTTPQLGGNLDGQTNNITNVGNLAVGLTTPASAAHVSSSTYPQLEIDDKASRNYAMGVTSSEFRIRDVTGATDRLTIDSGGAVGFPSGTFGGIQEDTTNSRLYLGKKAVGLKAGNSGNKLHFLNYEGSLSNGTYTIKNEVTMSENGYAGHWYLSAVGAGQGVCRIYRFTGRFAATQITATQGGTRNSGEDAYLSFQGGNNTAGMRLVLSGFYGNASISIGAVLCMSNTNEYFINV